MTSPLSTQLERSSPHHVSEGPTLSQPLHWQHNQIHTPKTHPSLRATQTRTLHCQHNRRSHNIHNELQRDNLSTGNKTVGHLPHPPHLTTFHPSLSAILSQPLHCEHYQRLPHNQTHHKELHREKLSTADTTGNPPNLNHHKVLHRNCLFTVYTTRDLPHLTRH